MILISSSGQTLNERGKNILFHGIVMDGNTLIPLNDSQITINGIFTGVSDADGKFALDVNRKDTVLFSRLGYRTTKLLVSDTLSGNEFLAGIFMNADTIPAGEVIIMPRFSTLRSEIMNAGSSMNQQMENAKFNLAVSAYQGRISQNRLGDPSSNYEYIRQKQRVDAYEKGGIPSDKIAALSPLLLIPAVYMLMNGMPQKQTSLLPRLTDNEVNQLHRKYLETLKQKNDGRIMDPEP